MFFNFHYKYLRNYSLDLRAKRPNLNEQTISDYIVPFLGMSWRNRARRNLQRNIREILPTWK